MFAIELANTTLRNKRFGRQVYRSGDNGKLIQQS